MPLKHRTIPISHCQHVQDVLGTCEVAVASPRANDDHRPMDSLRLYTYRASPNCLKVRMLLAQLELPYERVETDILGGGTMTVEFAAFNPQRKVPVLVRDGRAMTESNAILWWLAEGTAYLPHGARAHADVVRWLVFEQAEVAAVAAIRFRTQTGLMASDDPALASWRKSGARALKQLQLHLLDAAFLVDGAYSIADIANYAYVHVAEEAGFALSDFPAVAAWVARVEAQPRFTNDLEPLDPSPRWGHGQSIYG
jgi:glutathione S-transferase